MTLQAPIGARLPRHEDMRLVTGRGRYLGDLKAEGMLHLAFVRSPHAHARITGIDTTEAAAHPGVIAVYTGADIKEGIRSMTFPMVLPNLPGRFEDYWPLAVDKVNFHGEPVVAIVAEDRYIAADAAELVMVDYDPLPAVLSIEQAAQPGAPRIYESWPDNTIFALSFTGGFTEESVAANVSELDEIIASAPVVVQETFRTHRTGITPLETRGTLAIWDDETGLTCHTTTQRPHIERLALAEVLDLPSDMVRVIAPRDQGGGFGVKAPFYREPVLTSWLARELRCPVRWQESREESLMMVGQERDQQHELTLAATEDGQILGLRARIKTDTGDGRQGVYWGFVMPFLGAALLPSGYDIAKADVQLECLVTNKPCLSPSRSFGTLPGRFAMERMLDLLADRVGQSGLEIRLKNIVKELPYTTACGGYLDSGNFVQVIESLAKTIDVDAFRAEQEEARRNGRYLGLGFGTGAEISGVSTEVFVTLENQPGYGAATVRIDARGKVQVVEGDAPTGTSHETVFAQIAAQVFGISPDDVTVKTGDTETTPFGAGSVGSRGGSYTVSAVANAARALRLKIARIFLHDQTAAALAEDRAAPADSPEDVVFEGDTVRLASDPARSVPFRDMADRIIMRPVNLPAGEQAGLEATDYFEAEKGMVSFSAHACIVEVDPATGDFTIRRYVTCEDAGTVINPLVVEGQVQGGVIQGLSNAIFEEFLYDEEGQQMSTNFEAYKMAVAPDMPHVEVTHEYTPCPYTPLGSRGLGEGIPGPVPGALVNAICDALRPFCVSINRLPVRPARIWEKLQAARDRP